MLVHFLNANQEFILLLGALVGRFGGDGLKGLLELLGSGFGRWVAVGGGCGGWEDLKRWPSLVVGRGWSIPTRGTPFEERHVVVGP